MRPTALVLASAVCLLSMGGAATCSRTRPAARLPDRFATVNGVRLHYLDWGGDGPPLLFLTPLGGDVIEQFASLAPQFTDRFRVLGLARDYPGALRGFAARDLTRTL